MELVADDGAANADKASAQALEDALLQSLHRSTAAAGGGATPGGGSSPSSLGGSAGGGSAAAKVGEAHTASNCHTWLSVYTN